MDDTDSIDISARRNDIMIPKNLNEALYRKSTYHNPRRFNEDEEDKEIIRTFSGLISRSSRTQDHILEGFWMQGNFVVFLTIDDAMYIYLEVYEFGADKIKPICERVFLCDSNRFDRTEIKLNLTRDLIAVILYNVVSKLSTNSSQQQS
jgi:hypothetical protein